MKRFWVVTNNGEGTSHSVVELTEEERDIVAYALSQNPFYYTGWSGSCYISKDSFSSALEARKAYTRSFPN